MQLVILLAVLFLSGQKNFSQIKPLIEEFGGEEAKSAIKQAEELNQLISTVQTFASPQGEGNQPTGGGETSGQPTGKEQPLSAEQPVQTRHPLDPIKNVADERTLSAFSTLIALGE
ncbi:MAG: hypothetical protein ACI4VK_00610 [Candidatus Coproplasma sp.]